MVASATQNGQGSVMSPSETSGAVAGDELDAAVASGGLGAALVSGNPAYVSAVIFAAASAAAAAFAELWVLLLPPL